MSSLTIQNVTLIDGTGSQPAEHVNVHVEHEKIVAIDYARSSTRGDLVIDGKGLTLTPGLIDAHVHVGYPLQIDDLLSGKISPAEHAAAIFDTLGDALEQGFTALRDVAGLDGGVVAAIEKRGVRGPRVWCAGAGLCQTGGHGHMAPTWEPPDTWAARGIAGLATLAFVVDSPDAVRRAARENFRRGASFIKMCVSGGVISEHDKLSDTQFTIDEVKAAVEEASARGTYVTVHAHNNAGIRNAVAAGVLCIEHGSEIDDATAQLMARHAVALVPTLAIHATLEQDAEELGFPPEVCQRVVGKLAQGISATRAALRAGVKVGLGSDLAGHRQTFRGLELELRSGFQDPLDVLTSASSINAQIMRVSDQIGAVRPGLFADMVLWDGNPVEQPSMFNTRDRAVVVLKGGRIVKDLR